MKFSRSWECTYRHDRRAHRHRCHNEACRKIINAGEEVLMWRCRDGRTTKAIHIDCADAPHPCGTYRDAIALWSAIS